MQKWLSIIGIGEDGLSGLSSGARLLVEQATTIVGGNRHLAMLPDSPQQKLVWSSPIEASIQQVLALRGQPICILASGDPMCYGIGVTFLRYLPIHELTIVPAASAFSLACARLGWSLTEVELLSLCGRDPNLIHAALYPGAQLLILSATQHTPAIVAKLLTQSGFGQSQITVLEHMGGQHERIIEGTATNWHQPSGADLNTIAVQCIADPGVTGFSRLPGLPDSAYQHDGQLTKREIRAATLSALAPCPGQLLWDIGAGCGSIGIEWLRSHPRCRAIAIEQHPTRLQYIADNAAALGTPTLQIIAGTAPMVLPDLPQPDAIFIGGGITTPNLFETCWDALRWNGRLVINTVTIAGEQKLLQWQSQFGGELTRLAVQRAEPIGTFLGWKPLAPITQWVAIKRN